MALKDVTATLKKLRRQIAKGSTPEVKRERELYSALLGLVDFVEELNAGLVLAGPGSLGLRSVYRSGSSVSLPVPLWNGRGGIAPPSLASRPSSRLNQYPARSYLITVPVGGTA